MKETTKKYFQKWIYVAFVVIFVSILFKIYELDLYTWSCESEGNTGSCLLASRLYKEADNLRMSEKYLRISCDGKYALACHELGLKLIDEGKRQEGESKLDLACEQGLKLACKNNLKVSE